MMQAMRAALRLLLRLCAFVFLLVSCHALVGDYEVAPDEGPEGSPTGACRPGDWTCNREFLLECTKDGVWKTSKACQTASQCDKTAKSCTVCAQEGVKRCNGAQREFCNKTRSAWEPFQTCNAPDECSPTRCGPCIAGEIQCSGEMSRDLQVCNANSRWEKIATCETPTLCERSVSKAMTDPTWTPQCLTPSCVAGTLSCEGSTLQRCRQSQDGVDRIDICASPALCQVAATSGATGEAMCPTGCSPPGSFRCTDNAVEECAADQTGWLEPVPCADGRICDSETGECGAPCELGMKRCNAGTLEACSAEGNWATEQVCATVALCVKGPPVECKTPVCAPQQTRCTGARLERCNDDRTEYVPVTTCASEALCQCTQDGGACTGGIDANGCGVPVCMPLETLETLETREMPLRCAPGNPLLVEICDESLNGWKLQETCDAGEFCYPADRAAPCQVECPAPLLCNGAELLSCTVKGPPVHQADCATPTLCDCAVSETCSKFPNGCGIPQCGGTLPLQRCDGSILQTCQVGRNGWDDADCGDGALCYPGEPPAFTGGYCALCATAGVVECNDAATGIRTCAPDRLSYVAESACPLGCLERPGPSADYCAVCAEGELRCNGTLPGASRVRQCNEDRAGLTDVGLVCEHGCLDPGNTDQCAVCQAGEKRCMGNQLMACNAERTALTPETTCSPACINSGTNDYCGSCSPGSTQCSGDLLQTCQASGSPNAGMNCPNGCVDTSSAEAVCAPLCRPGSYRCAGTGSRFLQQCNANGDGWTAGSDCGSAALCDQPNQECDECTSGQYSCTAAGQLRSCNASGKWASTSTTNCFGGSLYTCTGSTLNGPQACTLCDDVNNECDDCVAATTPYSCSAGTLRSCNGTGHWVSTAGQNCFSGSLYTCSGSALTGPQVCTICDEANNQCDVCSPGAYSCSAGSLQVCNGTGQGYDPGTAPACVGTTLRSCSGATLSTSQCPVGMPLCNTAQTSCVSGCTNGNTRCNVNTLQTCVAQEWVSEGAPCANGCFGGAGPSAYCGMCSGGTQCMGAQPQTCSMGQWTNTGTACSGADPVCVAATGTCVACTAMNPGACAGATPVCLDNECVGCATSANCTGEVCDPTTDTCVECFSDANCDPDVCDTTDNTCVTCLTNAHCAPDVCDTTDNTCVGCLTDAHCAPDVCDTTDNTCVTCLTNAHCAPDVCDTASNTCVQCLTDGDCEPDLETCVNGMCTPVTP